MSDNNISRRKALAAIAGTGTAAALGGAGTFAYITDSNTAKVSFQAGSIVLQISPKTIDFTSETLAEGEDNGQDDGDEMMTTVTIQNTGTLPAKKLWISGVSLGGPEDLKANAEITTLNILYPGASPVDALDSSSAPYYGDATDADNSNGFLDLDDLRTRIANTAPLPVLKDGQQLQPLQGNQLQIELGVTYNYENITSNGGTLGVDFTFQASQ